jgi:hypothetical protein
MFVEVRLRFVVQFGLDDWRGRRSGRGATAIFRERFAREHEVVFLAASRRSGGTLLAFWAAIFEARLSATVVKVAIWRTAAIVAIVGAA